MFKVMMVCSGNTCRSPMAEVLLQAETDKAGMHVLVDSCGLGAFAGSPATEYAAEAVKRRGLSLTKHRSKPFSPEMAREFDLFLTMTAGHKAMLLSLCPKLSGKVFTLKEFAAKGEAVEDPDIHDPYGGNSTRYGECADEIETGVKKATNVLKALIS